MAGGGGMFCPKGRRGGLINEKNMDNNIDKIRLAIGLLRHRKVVLQWFIVFYVK